jgi:acetylornithine/succinyldiaminopimelate/putrescine aminotransferase
VRGRGLLLAIQFDREVAQAVLEAALARGVLLNAVSPSTIRFMPPLVITEAEIDQAIAVLEEALAATLTPASRS